MGKNRALKIEKAYFIVVLCESCFSDGFPGLLSDSPLRVRIGKTQRTRLVFRNLFFFQDICHIISLITNDVNDRFY